MHYEVTTLDGRFNLLCLNNLRGGYGGPIRNIIDVLDVAGILKITVQPARPMRECV